MKRSHLHVVVIASAIALSIGSFLVVMRGATDEPYVSFHRSDAIVQVGVAMLLMLLWVQLAAGVIWGVVRRRISAWCLPLLILVLICEFYLSYCPSGYVQDITRYVAVSH